MKGKLCALWERQDSLGGRHGEPVAALPGRKNDDSLIGIEWIAVRVGLASSAGRGHGGDAEVPISGVPFEYLLDFNKVGRGLVTVNAGLTGPAYRLSDEHHAGIVVLVLRGLESDPFNARFGATARYRISAWCGATAWYGARAWYQAAPASKNRHQKPYLRQRYKLPHEIKLRADGNSYY